MNCWKTISIESEFGKERLWLLSALMMLIYFLLFYVTFRTVFQGVPLVDYGILFLIGILTLTVPLHLLLHCVPIWIVGKNATFGVRKDQWPYFYYSTKDMLSKRLVIISFCFPAIIITILSIIITILHPEWLHYVALASAFNFGMCVYDFINLKMIKSAPKKSFIEEHKNGYHVLYTNNRIATK